MKEKASAAVAAGRSRKRFKIDDFCFETFDNAAIIMRMSRTLKLLNFPMPTASSCCIYMPEKRENSFIGGDENRSLSVFQFFFFF